MSALDQEMEIPSAPWAMQWLQRTLPSYRLGTSILYYTLSTCIGALGIIAFLSARDLDAQLAAPGADRPSIAKTMNHRLRRVCRGHLYITNLYMLAVFIIAGVDGYISFVTLGNDVSTHPETWTLSFVAEVSGYVLYLLVLFSAAFAFVPIAQVFFCYWALTRFARKRGASSLNAYIPEARVVATFVAQTWGMVCFYLQAWTSPVETSIWRWIALQAAVGSAVAWVDASFAFNFGAHRLADADFSLASTGVKDVVAMFGKTVLVLHSKGEKKAEGKEESLLQQVDFTDEKTGEV